MQRLISKEMLKRLFGVIIGTLILSVGINTFIIPHKLLAGGVAGIAIILKYLTNIPTGIIVFLINIPIFILGTKKIDKNFAFISLVGMLSLSGFLVLTEPLSNVARINDILASAIYGGLFTGLGTGIIFRMRASTGGTDIVSILLKKQFEISVPSLLFSMNVVIVLVGSFISSYVLAIYTLIGMFISSTVANKILTGLDTKKLLLIVTKHEDTVSNAIIDEINRGVTFLDGAGAYTRKRRKIIYCVVTKRQLAKVKKIVEDTDKNSFMSILDTSEILGHGFKKPVF
ncbi:MAG: YitT family protein [Firmicutes bacterium]|nr:YitT family protein [Bacillota bacterium]